MYFAEFESICGTGETVEKAVNDFQEAYREYNSEDAPFTDMTIYEVIKKVNVTVKYELV